VLKLLRSAYKRWLNWAGDRELETAIRRHLTVNGHFGGSAKLENVRLAAVERPGWSQVYRFEAIARIAPPTSDDDIDQLDPDANELTAGYTHLFGLVREDVRHNQTIVRTFDNPQDRLELFAEWSKGLIQLRGGQALS
jgi:hypothetical protein